MKKIKDMTEKELSSKYFHFSPHTRDLKTSAKVFAHIKEGKPEVIKKDIFNKVRGCAYTIKKQTIKKTGRVVLVELDVHVHGNTKYLRSGVVWESCKYPPKMVGVGGTYTEMQEEGWTEEKGGPVKMRVVYPI